MNRSKRKRLQKEAAKRGHATEPQALRPVARAPLWPLALLVLTACIVYANSFTGVFLLDDVRSIVENQGIRSFDHLWNDRPLVTLTLALNYHFGQLAVWGYHLVNLVIHLLAGLILYGLVRRILLLDTFRASFERNAHVIALAIALIWLVHPLQTQGVTYIIQRGESMMALFYLLTLYFVFRGINEKSPRRWFSCAVVACALGMLSKAVMVTAPVVVLLLDVGFATRSPGETLRRRWGLYVGLATTWIVLGTTGVPGVIFTTDPAQNHSAGFSYQGFSSLEYLQTQPAVILHYLRLAIWPHPLCLDYWWPIATTPAAIVPPGLAIIAVLIAIALSFRRWPWFGALGASFFLILSPTSSIVPIKDVAFEHRMYLPLVVPITLVVLGVHHALTRWAVRSSGRAPNVNWIAAGILILVTVACGSLTIIRNADYHSEFSMWSDVVAKRPLNPRAHTDLGKILAAQGRVDEAIEHYERALQIEPKHYTAHNNLGNALVRQGRIDEGIPHFHEAIRLRPRDGMYHNSLGVARLQKGEFAEAGELFAKAVQLQPNYPAAHSNLANVLAAQGKTMEAIAQYEEALRLQPGFADAHNNLAVSLLDLGRVDEAITHLEEAVRLKPGYTDAVRNLAEARSRARQ